jgi:hypothetical protein
VTTNDWVLHPGAGAYAGDDHPLSVRFAGRPDDMVLYTLTQTTGCCIQVLERTQETIERKFAETVSFFGEDPTKSTCEEFFGLFFNFANEFARVRRQTNPIVIIIIVIIIIIIIHHLHHHDHYLPYCSSSCSSSSFSSSSSCRFQAKQEMEKKRLMEEKAAKRRQTQEKAAEDKRGAGADGDDNLVDNILGEYARRHERMVSWGLLG